MPSRIDNELGLLDQSCSRGKLAQAIWEVGRHGSSDLN